MPPILRRLRSIFQVSLRSVSWDYILQGFFDQNSPRRRQDVTYVFLGNTGDGIQVQKQKREAIAPASSFPPRPALRSPIPWRPNYLAGTFQINCNFFLQNTIIERFIWISFKKKKGESVISHSSFIIHSFICSAFIMSMYMAAFALDSAFPWEENHWLALIPLKADSKTRMNVQEVHLEAVPGQLVEEWGSEAGQRRKVIKAVSSCW